KSIKTNLFSYFRKLGNYLIPFFLLSPKQRFYHPLPRILNALRDSLGSIYYELITKFQLTLTSMCLGAINGRRSIC
ncbi:MAG: hypothetical protein ACFE8U_15885, partial [Candidatus Hermodarchaeota archaeon]